MTYNRFHDPRERSPNLRTLRGLRAGEEEPIGLVLCAEKSTERVEVLELETRGIRVAEYLTELPSREVLARRLHEAVRHARERLARHEASTTVPPALPAAPAKRPQARKEGRFAAREHREHERESEAH